MPINPLEGIPNPSSSLIPSLQSSQLSPPKQPQVAQTAIQGIPPTIVDQLKPSEFGPSVTRSLGLPVFTAPNPGLNYPVINVPTQEEYDAAVRAEKQKEKEEKEEKKRELPDAPPIMPAINAVQPQDKPESTTNTQLTTDKPISAEIQVPILGAVPIPTNKEVALAGTTAMAATAAALLGKSAVEFLLKFFKPIANQVWIRGKKLLSKDLTDYELQLFFAFEKDKQMKAVAKKLQKEFKLEKKRQHDSGK